MSFDARRYTIDGLTKQLLLLELHIRDGSVWECGCSWDAHLPLIEGLAEEGVKFAQNEEEKQFFDRLMHLAREARLKLQYGIEGEGMEVEGEHSSNPEHIHEIKRVERLPFNFVLYSDGSIRVSTRGIFQDIEKRPELKKEAEEIFKEELKELRGSSNPVGITGESERYIHETLQAKEICDPRSFRTVVRNEHRIVVCCPKGEWDTSLPEGEQCRVGTVAQKILHPIWEKEEHAIKEG